MEWKQNLRVGPGRPLPFGLSARGSGMNFSVYSREEKVVALVLFPKTGGTHTASTVRVEDEDRRRVEISLDPSVNRTGLTWHVHVSPYLEEYEYLWRIGGTPTGVYGTNLCLDPYARMLNTPRGPETFNDPARSGADFRPRAVIPPAKMMQDFDWSGVVAPRIPLKDLIIYEMHVRGFTRSPESDVRNPGTFLGVVERIPYLRELGINCVELLPVFEFNECEWGLKNPITGQRLSQYWGYSTVNFFSPMNRFATEHGNAIDEFRIMVRELHRYRIEVFLDVVFNHTAEMGDDFLPPGFYHMKGLAKDTYYIRENDRYHNYSGCGNTVSANNPIVSEWIHDCVRYWVHEMGVDGFRFDLASCLTRDTKGRPMAEPPVLQRITKDPTLRQVKFIAEPWDCGGLYQVGSFPHFGAWAEWNGRFRDVIRSFIRGSPCKQDFATRLCGSEDLYGFGRRPFHSINFVTAHDGFSLRDLVSFNSKHNDENGENNKDGENHNNSWNCGNEGDCKNRDVTNLRLRQSKNFLVALMLSAGVPMLSMGDEYGHTKNGNNNAWCQDGELNWFKWKLARGSSLVRFFKCMIHLRKKMAFLKRDQFIRDKDIEWHGSQPNQPNWGEQYNFLAFTLRDHLGGQDIYVAFNCGGSEYSVTVPSGKDWFRIVDTSQPSPKDFIEDDRSILVRGTVKLMPYSCILLKMHREGHSFASDAFSRKLTSLHSVGSNLGLAFMASTSPGGGVMPISRTSSGEHSPPPYPMPPSGLLSPIPPTEARQPPVLKESSSFVNLAAPQPMPRSPMFRWDVTPKS